MKQRLAQEHAGPSQSADPGHQSRAQRCDATRHAPGLRLFKRWIDEIDEMTIEPP
jgi:hypothetical protein